MSYTICNNCGRMCFHTEQPCVTCQNGLISHVKEAKELAEIIEMDRGITMTINTAHHHNLGKPKKLKPYWKNGKLKYK